MSTVPRRLLAGLLGLEVVGIVWLVLNPSPATPTGAVANLSDALAAIGVPAALADTSLIEFYLNVQLFVPLTILCSLLWPRVKVWGWLVAGLLISSTLEWLQMQFLSDRTSTSRDIIANTLGAGVGAGTVFVVRWLQENEQARRAVLPRRKRLGMSGPSHSSGSRSSC